MTSSSFPDINVWLALLLEDHVHRAAALEWWDGDESETIAFCRVTQLGVLRLLTTAAAMNGKPRTNAQAWAAYERLFEDERVALAAEPPGLDAVFQRMTAEEISSSKVWADAYLAAFALQARGAVVTFDRALAARSAGSLLLAGRQA